MPDNFLRFAWQATTTLHIEAENKDAAVKAAEKSFYNNCNLYLDDAETDTWEVEEE